jgi:hypothetical protein
MNKNHCLNQIQDAFVKAESLRNCSREISVSTQNANLEQHESCSISQTLENALIEADAAHRENFQLTSNRNTISGIPSDVERVVLDFENSVENDWSSLEEDDECIIPNNKSVICIDIPMNFWFFYFYFLFYFISF